MLTPAIVPLHETAWLIRWPPGIDAATNARVHACAAWLRRHAPIGLLQIVPAYDSLLVEFSTTVLPQMQEIEAWLQWAVQQASMHAPEMPSAEVQIPVCFDHALPNDLEFLAANLQLPVQEILTRCISATYQVFMLGFLPGFAYMGPLHESLVMPRRSQPRVVKAGAVAMADGQVGIYPRTSPGGWHILGYTPLRMFDAAATTPALLQPGMSVRFEPISFTQYQALL